jgi:hypothetical protein
MDAAAATTPPAVNPPSLTFVDLRGSTFAIENPTDIHIRTVEMYVRAQSSDRRRQKDLAHAICSMIPSLPEHWVSVQEFEMEDGSSRIKASFNLQSYELLAITNQAAIAYLNQLVYELKQAKPVDKAEEAEIRNQLVRLEKTLKDTLSEIQNPILVILRGGETSLATAALDKLTQAPTEPESTEPKQGFAAPVKPQSKSRRP